MPLLIQGIITIDSRIHYEHSNGEGWDDLDTLKKIRRTFCFKRNIMMQNHISN